jgi:hypothetical protein
MASGTHRDLIIETLRLSSRPLDDDQISERAGIRPRQTVNQICRALAREGTTRRYHGPDGKIVNELADGARTGVDLAGTVPGGGDRAAAHRAVDRSQLTPAAPCRSAFLIMPFDARFDWIRGEIEAAGEGTGYKVERGDDIFSPGTVLEQVEDRIATADAVIAVCTGKNPNVFYELGLARPYHDAILVAESKEDLPFDVAHLRAILYGNNPVTVRGSVAGALRSVADAPRRPVLRHLAVEVVAEQLVSPMDSGEVYWIDAGQVAHRIPDQDTVALYSTRSSIVKLAADQFRRLRLGEPMPPLRKEDFRRINTDVFVVHQGSWFYLNTLAPIYRFGWDAVVDLPEMTAAERRTHRPRF